MNSKLKQFNVEAKAAKFLLIKIMEFHFDIDNGVRVTDSGEYRASVPLQGGGYVVIVPIETIEQFCYFNSITKLEHFTKPIVKTPRKTIPQVNLIHHKRQWQWIMDFGSLE